MTTASRLASLAFLGMAMVAACKKKPETAVTPAGNTGPAPTATCDAACQRAKADSIERARLDAVARARAAEAAERDRLLGATKATLARHVLFDYDQAELAMEGRAILDAKLPILRANPALRLRVNGHADERGSDEYNLALGQRRAAAVKRYLTDQGVDAGRIDIMSFGEERPLSTDGTEAGFRLNRRADFDIVAGESTLVPVR